MRPNNIEFADWQAISKTKTERASTAIVTWLSEIFGARCSVWLEKDDIEAPH
jgi:hypothetical protein